MLRTLRARLVFSHVLPFFIIVPIMGIFLIYIIETQYLIPNLARNLERDAQLIANITRYYPEMWGSPRLAQSLLARLEPGQTQRVMLITPQGYLLASTDPQDALLIDQYIEIPGLAEVLKGITITHNNLLNLSKGKNIDVEAPVLGVNGEVIGIVRLSYRYATSYDEFIRLRYIIGGILLISLVIGILIGSVLAMSIEKPIKQVTQAVDDLARGARRETLPEIGPIEIIQLQRAANHLVERLHSLEDTRKKLLANLVHELGRPLGALRAAIQALIRGAKEDAQLMNELLKGMDEEAAHLQRLTENLADLHDQVLGSLELDYKKVPLSEWLGRILLPWQAAANDKRLKWQTMIPSDLPTIQADQNRLGQVMGNIISNAIKYTPSGGTVTVSAGVDGNEVWFRVSDTGPGIPVEDREKIFTPFYRGSHGNRFPQGLGLGLSIAKDLVNAHKGRIEVESSPGSFTQFTVRLPIV